MHAMRIKNVTSDGNFVNLQFGLNYPTARRSSNHFSPKITPSNCFLKYMFMLERSIVNIDQKCESLSAPIKVIY